MKELWKILMDKLREVEPTYAAIGIGISGLLAMALTTKIIVALLHTIVEIVNAFAGQPVS